MGRRIPDLQRDTTMTRGEGNLAHLDNMETINRGIAHMAVGNSNNINSNANNLEVCLPLHMVGTKDILSKDMLNKAIPNRDIHNLAISLIPHNQDIATQQAISLFTHLPPLNQARWASYSSLMVASRLNIRSTLTCSSS